jgi:hypothetical protein
MTEATLHHPVRIITPASAKLRVWGKLAAHNANEAANITSAAAAYRGQLKRIICRAP